jgi:hypothetical protein
MELMYGLKMLNSNGIQKMADIGLFPFFLMLIVSLLSSVFISHLYLKCYGVKGTGSTIHRAFPLLGVSITSIFVSLQFSIPLSLGLLGALSIVRFRTPIKDPEEIGFILLVIASSLTCATFNLPFLSLILIVSLFGLFILKKDKFLFRKSAHEGMLSIVIPTQIYNSNVTKLDDILMTKESLLQPDSVVETKITTTLNYFFSRLNPSDSQEIRKSLKDLDHNININLFYNNSKN